MLGLIAAAGVGSSLLRPRTTLVPAAFHAQWQSVGTRVVPGPGPGGINTYSLGILIDPTSIDIQNFHTDVVNSAELVAPDRLEIRATTMGDFWHCQVGNAGTYTFTFSSGDRQLTLTPATDACPERAAVLAGDWTRTDLGVLPAGRREAMIFRPFGGATTGRLAYAVPAGWTGTEMQDGLFALGRPNFSDQAAIRVISNAYPSDQDAPCGDNRAAAGIGRTPAEMAAWLRTLPGLIVSTPTAATVGGLDGVMVDLVACAGFDDHVRRRPLHVLVRRFE